MRNGTILDKIKTKKIKDDEKIWKYFVNLVKGIEYLHEKAKIIHFDIKADNLLFDDDDNLKICDFSISRIFYDGDDSFQYNKLGCPFYLSPESTLKNNKFHGRPVDIWACGVVLYYMTYSKLPFHVKSTLDHANLFEQIRLKE